MTTFSPQTLTIDGFLQLPCVEESPAWEYMDGVAMQKPMPKTRHSILQKRLLTEIDSHSQAYTALPELRCTFAGRSIVPDIAVIAWSRIAVNEVCKLCTQPWLVYWNSFPWSEGESGDW